jgi:hypothetical protein
VPADYMPRPFGDELARCQRYYEVNGNYLAFGGYAAAGGQVIQPFQYRAQKPVAPTVTKNGATWTISNCGQPVVTAFGVYGFGLHVIVTALGAFVTATTATDNVTSEANP